MSNFLLTCITPTEDSSLVGIGTDNPIGFTLNQFCDFFYNTKNFVCSVVGVSETWPSAHPERFHVGGTYYQNIYLDYPITNESYLSCNFFPLDTGVYYNNPAGFDYNNYMNQVGFIFYVTSPKVILYEGLYYPSILLELAFSYAIGGQTFFFDTTEKGPFNPLDNIVYNIFVNLGEVRFKLYGGAYGIPDDTGTVVAELKILKNTSWN